LNFFILTVEWVKLFCIPPLHHPKMIFIQEDRKVISRSFPGASTEVWVGPICWDSTLYSIEAKEIKRKLLLVYFQFVKD